MKMVKSLILGSAAGVLAISGAQAADLPVKAKPVEYVRICSTYGAGFFYVPGTDTCIKLGGFLRVDTTFNGSLYDQVSWSGDLGQGNRYRDYFSARSRMGLSVDTRTATEYGIVRTFGQGNFTFTTQGNNTVNPAFYTGSPGTGTATALLNNVGEGYVVVDLTFLQFAGFTFGKSASAYSTPWHGYPGNQTSFLLGGHDTITGVNNIQYSAQFGNGVSGTIGLDDPVVANRTAIYNTSYAVNSFANGGNTYAGVHAPDIVGNIRVSQDWGMFQISGAAHEVTASYNFLNGIPAAPGTVGIAGGAPTASSEIGGHPDTKWGGSVMAALQINNIPTGAGDVFRIDGSYAVGDTKNVISTSAASPNFTMFSGSGRLGAYQSVGFGATTDAVYLPGLSSGPFSGTGGRGDLKLTTSYGFRTAFTHNWDPRWATSLFGAVAAVRYGGSAVGFGGAFDPTTAKGQLCQAFVGSTGGYATKSADFRCNPDFTTYQIGSTTYWTPVKDLTFTAEVQYFYLAQNFAGTSALAPTAPKPTTVYEFKNQSTVSFMARAQRNF
jgi:porin-like protein